MPILNEPKPLPIPKCCVCGQELPPQQSLAETFGKASWKIASRASPETGLAAALYTALICTQCESIACYPCGGFRPETHPDGPHYSIACPICGGQVIPLNSDRYRAWLIKAGRALIEAVRQGDTRKAKDLIAAGADLSTQNPEGGIALHDAAKSGNVEVTGLLLEQGVDVNARDRINITPLYLAAWEGHTEVVKLLLDYAADMNVKDSMLGASPLLRATTSGHAEVVRVLAERGADVNLPDYVGESPLQLAKKLGHSRIVEILCAHGAKA